ncbi:hypothetical protein C475_06590 [Halosimplex carlsbadense 2-9-1]|uniref:Transcriptional regulator n=1 Tax=Halosimplex carlsbadense 2-9-1 TaxID=797114 RepID=M0CWG9_9EURY|nr:hypothetical protein [Halosimplex carlsbadense]ELZ27566.1 hypothetical protein C475_06590 [Halosimplex carlsbadense 2-9-1]
MCLSLCDLVEAIADRAAAADADRDARVAAIGTDRNHCHLPVLTEAGLVDRGDDDSLRLTADGRTAVAWLDEPVG